MKPLTSLLNSNQPTDVLLRGVIITPGVIITLLTTVCRGMFRNAAQTPSIFEKFTSYHNKKVKKNAKTIPHQPLLDIYLQLKTTVLLSIEHCSTGIKHKRTQSTRGALTLRNTNRHEWLSRNHPLTHHPVAAQVTMTSQADIL